MSAASAGLVLLMGLAGQSAEPPTQIGPPNTGTSKGSASDDRGASTAPNASVDAAAFVDDLLARLRGATRRVKSTKCTFYKEEWKNGDDLVPSRGTLKHRKNGDTFLAFESGPLGGRQILYRPKKNNGNLLVSNPMFNLNLDPDGFLPLRNSRHTIRKAGLLTICRTILDDVKEVKKAGPGVASYAKLAKRTIGGEKTSCFRSVFNKKKHPAFFAAKTEICISEESGLPVEIKVWQHEGGKIRRVGLYRYTKCKLNTLTDKDFDPDNPAYKF